MFCVGVSSGLAISALIYLRTLTLMNCTQAIAKIKLGDGCYPCCLGRTQTNHNKSSLGEPKGPYYEDQLA